MAKEKDIRQIYQLLADENLEAFYPAFRGQLKIEKVDQLLHVSRRDLSTIGIVSGPDIKHFQRVLGKITKHGGVRGTIKNKIFKGKLRDQKKDQSLLMKMELLIRQEAVIIQSNSVHIEKEIGKGQFGTVYQGQWIRSYGDESVRITIAIKSIASEQGQFGMGEAQVLSEFGQDHPNIIKFYGLMLGDSRSIKLVTEFAEYGSLIDQLMSGKIRQIAVLCQFAVQIASGMAYLEKSNLVHRDLAARNILVTAPNQVKISDFGLSKSLGDQQQFVMEIQEMLPLRWLAPECLNDGVFTTASDVWSFGVVLWEMFTLGQYPWELETGEQVRDHVRKGDVLAEPDYCPQRIYPYIMCRCWAPSAADRPRFHELHERLIIHQPVVVSATENSTTVSAPELSYSVNDSITCLKQVGDDADLWLGQSQETHTFGQFRKSKMRSLTPTILTPFHLSTIDSKAPKSDGSSKYTSHLPERDEFQPSAVEEINPSPFSTPSVPDHDRIPPLLSPEQPNNDPLANDIGVYVNMNGVNFGNDFAPKADVVATRSGIYRNIGLRVIDGTCEQYTLEEEENADVFVNATEDGAGDGKKTPQKSPAEGRRKEKPPRIAPKPGYRPPVPPKPMTNHVASHVEDSSSIDGAAVGDNARESAVGADQGTPGLIGPIVLDSDGPAGSCTYMEIDSGGSVAQGEREEGSLPKVKDKMEKLFITKQISTKSARSSKLYEDGESYANLWDSNSSSKSDVKQSKFRNSLSDHTLDGVDFSKSFPVPAKKRIPRSQSTSGNFETAANPKKNSTSEVRSPDLGKEKKRHFTLSLSMRNKSTDQPRSKQGNKLDSNVLLDYIRRIKQEIPDARDWECISALEANQDIVDFAIKHIKVNRIMDGGLFKREDDACQLLVSCGWELEPAVRESKVRFLRHNFPSIGVLECTETLENFNWSVHEVSESFICRRYLEACSNIGVSQDVALLTLEKHNRDELEAVRYLKATSVQEVTGRPYLRCREILSNCKWDVANSIDYLLDFNRNSQP